MAHRTAPPSEETVARILELRAQGMGAKKVAQELGLAPKTVIKYTKLHQQPPPPEQTKGGDDKKPPVAPTAASLGGVNILDIVPRRITITSSLLHQTMMATRIEWHWPELSVDDWLDTFFFHMMKQHGIILGAYMKLERKVDDGQGG